MPTVNTDAFSRCLEDFAKERGVGPDKQLVVVLDGAGYHTANDVEVPEGIHLVIQPAYSPELQPSERLWTLVDEPVANRVFDSLDKLEEVVGQRCCTLVEMRDVLRGRTHFHWWPNDLVQKEDDVSID